MLRHAHDEFHYVLDEQNRYSGITDTPNAQAQIMDLLAVHAGCRFVQQQQLRAGRRGAGKLQPPLFPECEVGCEFIAFVFQIGEFEQGGDLPPGLAGSAEPA